MQHVENIVKDLVEGEFGLGTLGGLLEVGDEVAVELSTRDLGGDRIVEELAISLSTRLGAHRNVPT